MEGREVSKRIKPLYGQEREPGPDWEQELAAATSVEEVNEITARYVFDKSAPVSEAFGDNRKRKLKQIKGLKRSRSYDDPRPAIASKKKRRRKKRRSERPTLSAAKKPTAKHPGNHREESHGNWSQGRKPEIRKPRKPVNPNKPSPSSQKQKAPVDPKLKTTDDAADSDKELGTKENPIVTDDVNEAIALLAEGKYVELNQPDEVSTLLDKMSEYAQEAQEAGNKAEDIDLCRLTVAGTNIFCVQNVGVERINMPQFSGKAAEGSRAYEIGGRTGEANVSGHFVNHLKSQGIAVTEEMAPASHLRASQNQLIGTKVGGIMDAMNEGKLEQTPIFVSRDNYVIDGHHRWAANVGIDFADNKAGDYDIPVIRLDVGILEALDMANEFATGVGILPKGAPGVEERSIVKHADHKQEDHGNWASGAKVPDEPAKVTFHRYGRATKIASGETRGGRYGDLSGQDYWAEVNGRRWEIESSSSRGGGGRRLWMANTGSIEGNDYDVVIGWGRKDLVEKIREYGSGKGIVKHYGPGPHSSGTPQSTHGAWSRGLSADQRVKDLEGDIAEGRPVGFTIHVPSGAEPTKGWSVALEGHESRVKLSKLSTSSVQAYRQQHAEALQDPSTSWGAWLEGGDVFFDVSVVEDDPGEAIKLARSSDQIGIFNLETGETVRLDDDARIAELLGPASIEKGLVIGFTPRRSATRVKSMSANPIVKHAATGAGGNHPSGSPQSVHGSGGGGKYVTKEIRIQRSGGERPCVHPNCATLHWNLKDAVWDLGDHIVPDNTWVVLDADTDENLWHHGAGVEGMDTKREAIEWAKQNYPDIPIDSKPTPKPPPPPPEPVDFDSIGNFQQAKAMGMLASKWVSLPEEEQRRLWAEAKIMKHYGPGPHPGTMSPQDVHGAGGGGSSSDPIGDSPQENASDAVLGETEKRQNLPRWFEGGTPPPGSYWIADTRMGDVEKKFGQLNRRGEKYGLEPFKMEVVDRHEQVVADQDMGWSGEGQSVVAWSLVQVNGTPPSFEGWEFAGRIEHLPTMESEGEDLFNILHMRPDFEGDFPEQYRNSGPDCEVCNRKVYRKDTFLVHNTKTDEWKQVGRDDLTLFTGATNPAASKFYLQVFDDLEESEFFEPSGWGNAYVSDTGTYLARVAAEVREHGYVSASSLKDDFGNRVDSSSTTAEIVLDREYYKTQYADKTPESTPADIQLAEDAQAYYSAYETPPEVAAFRDYKAKYQFDDDGYYTGDYPDIYPPDPMSDVGTYGWKEGNSAELYSQRVDFWKKNVMGTPLDPTGGKATIEFEIFDGIGVEVIHHSQSLTEKGMRDLYKAETNDSFMMNMKAAAITPFTTRSNAGLQAYVVPGYQRHLAQVELDAIRAAKPQSEWVGTVGERQRFDLTIYEVKNGWKDSGYGEKEWVLTKTTDPDGNLVHSWYSGKFTKVPSPDPEGYEDNWKAGDVVHADAKVKSHDVDQYSDDQKVTWIERLTKVEVDQS